MCVCVSLTEAVKHPEVKRTLGVLQVAKSRVLRTWRELVRFWNHVFKFKLNSKMNFIYSSYICVMTDWLTGGLILSGQGHHCCGQRGQRQRQVSLHPGQVLWTAGEMHSGKNQPGTFRQTCCFNPQLRIETVQSYDLSPGYLFSKISFKMSQIKIKEKKRRIKRRNLGNHIDTEQLLFSKLLCSLTDQNVGAHSRPDDQHQDDPHRLSVLQHLREDDLSTAQDHQPDDHHLQEPPVSGRGPHLGPQQVQKTTRPMRWDELRIDGSRLNQQFRIN